jgi:GR25 family glycosyltransferase involved in LPS biosynthesis
MNAKISSDDYKVNYLKIVFSSKKKHAINQYSEEIFIINLSTNKIRRNYIMMIMKKYKINFTLVLVEPINNNLYNIINKNKKLTKSEVGCSLSHMCCLNKMIKEEIKNAIILEDDIIFHKDFQNMFSKIMKKHNYDFLLLGACDFNFSKMNYENVTEEGLYRPKSNSPKLYGAHAIYYSIKGATRMFEKINENLYFFDRDFHIMFNYFTDTSFICYPNLVVTDISTSNLNHNYPFFSETEKKYYLDCFIDFNFKNYHFLYLSLLRLNHVITIKENDTYETYLEKLIQYTFKNPELQIDIKNRLVMDFFDLNDLQFLLTF